MRGGGKRNVCIPPNKSLRVGGVFAATPWANRLSGKRRPGQPSGAPPAPPLGSWRWENMRPQAFRTTPLFDRTFQDTRSAGISRNPLVSSLFEATGITHNDRRVSDMFEREVRRHCAQPPRVPHVRSRSLHAVGQLVATSRLLWGRACSATPRPISIPARRRPNGRYVVTIATRLHGSLGPAPWKISND